MAVVVEVPSTVEIALTVMVWMVQVLLRQAVAVAEWLNHLRLVRVVMLAVVMLRQGQLTLLVAVAVVLLLLVVMDLAQQVVMVVQVLLMV